MENHTPSLSFNADNIHSVVSLDPLLDFWEKNLAPKCSHMSAMFEEIKEKINQNPALQGRIHDTDILNDYPDVIIPLMSSVFPAASFHSDIMGALNPCTFEPFYVSPEFQRLFLDNKNNFKSEIKSSLETDTSKKLLHIYCLVLEKIYHLDCQLHDQMDMKIIPDEKTGLDRYYRITPDFQFVRVKALDPPAQLSKEERSLIAEHVTDIEILSRYIDLSKFEFTGFTIVKAVDITEFQVISTLERDLIDEHSMFFRS